MGLIDFINPVKHIQFHHKNLAKADVIGLGPDKMFDRATGNNDDKDDKTKITKSTYSDMATEIKEASGGKDAKTITLQELKTGLSDVLSDEAKISTAQLKAFFMTDAETGKEILNSKKLAAFLKTADTDKSGSVSEGEFAKHLKKETLKDSSIDE
jgi:hypothetical protein